MFGYFFIISPSNVLRAFFHLSFVCYQFFSHIETKSRLVSYLWWRKLKYFGGKILIPSHWHLSYMPCAKSTHIYGTDCALKCDSLYMCLYMFDIHIFGTVIVMLFYMFYKYLLAFGNRSKAYLV